MSAATRLRRVLWIVAVCAVPTIWAAGLVGAGVLGVAPGSGAELLSDAEMAGLRGQGICAKCETTATTACPATGNPCFPMPCQGTRYSAGDGITICTGGGYRCSSSGLRKGCQAAWSWWCNGNSSGSPCGTATTASCYPNIFGGCTCSPSTGGSCPKSNCT